MTSLLPPYDQTVVDDAILEFETLQKGEMTKADVMLHLSRMTRKTQDYWLLKEFVDKIMYKRKTVTRDSMRDGFEKYKSELEGLMESSYKQHPIIAEALWNLEEDKSEHVTPESLARTLLKLAKKRNIDESEITPLVSALVRMAGKGEKNG